GEPGPAHRLAARLDAETLEPLPRPPGALALHARGEHGVGAEEVVALERRRLVQDLVGRRHGGERTKRATGRKPAGPECTTGSRDAPGSPSTTCSMQCPPPSGGRRRRAGLDAGLEVCAAGGEAGLRGLASVVATDEGDGLRLIDAAV